MEHGPFEDGFPIAHGDVIPASYVSLPEGVISRKKSMDRRTQVSQLLTKEEKDAELRAPTSGYKATKTTLAPCE